MRLLWGKRRALELLEERRPFCMYNQSTGTLEMDIVPWLGANRILVAVATIVDRLCFVFFLARSHSRVMLDDQQFLNTM